MRFMFPEPVLFGSRPASSIGPGASLMFPATRRDLDGEGLRCDRR